MSSYPSYEDNQKKIKFFNELAPVAASILVERGPLSADALAVFIKSRTGHYVSPTEVSGIIIHDRQRRFTHKVRTSDGGGSLVYLSSDLNAEIITPSPSNFGEAYYELYDMLKFIKAHPDMASLPDEWINKARGMA